MAFTDFTAGDVFTAADADVLMRQSIMRFADASARDTALTGGVLDEGMHAYLEDTNALTYYTGAAWVTVYSDWTSFTPSWSNLTVGNGTQSGAYRYVNGDLRVRVSFTLGSTSSVGAAVSMTVPDSQTAVSSPRSFGAALFVDSGSGAEYPGVGRAAGTSVALFASNNNVAPTVPFTWATGDGIDFDVTVAL